MKSGRQELRDKEQLYTAWFDTFVQRTDEKEINAEIMGLIFSKLCATNLEIHGDFLDIGCGNGELSLKLAQLLKKLGVNFSYVGIDNKKDYVDATKKCLDGLVKSVDVIQGDCFGTDFERLPNQAAFLLASNIVNYTENPQTFIEHCIDKLGENGFGIFIHPEEGSSFLRLLQEYKNEPIVKTGANEVAKTFERLKIKNYLLSYCCAIHFPSMTNEIWDSLAANETETQKDFVIAKNLLEFFLKTPLDALNEKQLQNYLKAIQALMTADNKILVPMVFQIYLPKPTLEFEQTFSTVMKSIQQTLSLEKANLNNRFFSRQDKEEVLTYPDIQESTHLAGSRA